MRINLGARQIEINHTAQFIECYKNQPADRAALIEQYLLHNPKDAISSICALYGWKNSHQTNIDELMDLTFKVLLEHKALFKYIEPLTQFCSEYRHDLIAPILKDRDTYKHAIHDAQTVLLFALRLNGEPGGLGSDLIGSLRALQSGAENLKFTEELIRPIIEDLDIFKQVVHNVHDVRLLADICPQYKEQLIKMMLDPDMLHYFSESRFSGDGTFTLSTFHATYFPTKFAEDFPEHKEAFIQILCTNRNIFNRFIQNDDDLSRLAEAFPEDDRLQGSTVADVVAELDEDDKVREIARDLLIEERKTQYHEEKEASESRLHTALNSAGMFGVSQAAQTGGNSAAEQEKKADHADEKSAFVAQSADQERGRSENSADKQMAAEEIDESMLERSLIHK